MSRNGRALLVLLTLLASLAIVPRAVEAASTPPAVSLDSPSTAAPAVVATGSPISLHVTTDRPVRYRVGYRPAGTSTDLTPFPASVGTGDGTFDVGVVAPVQPGSYDIAVTVEADGHTVQVGALQALHVVGPALASDARCDDLDPRACLLPFPNDHFTGADPATATGRRVNLHIASMPRNVLGKPADPTEQNRNDGFSPGSAVLTHVPGIDLHATWGSELDHVQDLARYGRPDAPMVLLDADTGQRHPFWSELDRHATTDADRLLMPRPATNLLEGHRYIVALRDLRRADGSTIPAAPLFAAYRDRAPLPSPSPVAVARRAHMESIFGSLAAAGVGRDDLYLAWDFTVASERNLTERALHIRDEAFAALGDDDLGDLQVEGRPPAWTITSVVDRPDEDTMRRVEGTISVPNYLTPQVVVQVPKEITDQVDLPARTAAVPLSRFNHLGSTDGLPEVDPLQPAVDVPFVCNVPATAGREPAHPMLYGHGLIGDRGEANGSSTAALRRLGFAPCAVDWWGMSIGDLSNVALLLTDMSLFPSLADRSQQGFLNFLFLGRALRHPDGLRTDPAFAGPGGRPLLAADELFYDGNSQGGIMGGALVALAPDLTRAKLGVPGMNYSLLLNRSLDWEPKPGTLVERLPGLDPTDPFDTIAYGDVYYLSYPSIVDRQLGYSLMQMLWDRAEANGYAHHMTDDPLAGTPAHQVMLQVAFADHQVANVAAEVEGRTIGARLHRPVVPDGLHWAVDPTFGFDVWDPSVQGPLRGDSVLVYWHATDRGLGTPPNDNRPMTSGEDPHSDPRKDKAAAQQVAHFFLTGEVIDACGGGPCRTSAASR